MSINKEPSPKLPEQSLVERQLLRLLSGRSRPTDTQSVYRELADLMELCALQLALIDPASGRSAWEWLVRRAKQRLSDDGLLRCPQAGLWVLTPAGERAATVTAADLGL